MDIETLSLIAVVWVVVSVVVSPVLGRLLHETDIGLVNERKSPQTD
ncbi:MAG: hypothetical protein OEV31_02480 [Gammaproteobacteria bacterium]|nr:hypothetical protein [Gammaproteobacteria bacterium]